MSQDMIPPPLPSAPPPSPSTESIQVVIDKVQQRTGVFSKQTFRMVVTNTRLIFALQVKNKVDYAHQDPAVTLAENPANFAIPLTELQSIEVYKGDFDSNEPDTMVVKALGNKWNFFISNSYSVSSQLKKVLGNLVK